MSYDGFPPRPSYLLWLIVACTTRVLFIFIYNSNDIDSSSFEQRIKFQIKTTYLQRANVTYYETVNLAALLHPRNNGGAKFAIGTVIVNF